MTRYEPFMDKVDRARQLRVERKLSQTDLAKMMGVGANMVSRVESRARKISIEYIEKLVEALGISEAEFMGGTSVERQSVGLMPEIMAHVVYAMDEAGLVQSKAVSAEIKAEVMGSLYTLAEGYQDVGHDTDTIRKELVNDVPKQLRVAVANDKRRNA